MLFVEVMPHFKMETGNYRNLNKTKTTRNYIVNHEIRQLNKIPRKLEEKLEETIKKKKNHRGSNHGDYKDLNGVLEEGNIATGDEGGDSTSLGSKLY